MAGNNAGKDTEGGLSAGPSGEARPVAGDRGVVAVVGIGASAGGLEALKELFSNMPADTGMAFIVVTHLHPGHTSLLPELLDKITALPVVVATTGLKIRANHIYIGPPGGQLSVHAGKLQRLEQDAEHAPKMPINYFLHSLALDQRERAICIILSGTGSDGTLGLQEIKALAGMVMVEDPQSAKYAGMPSSAIATHLVDFVLPATAMPTQLLQYVYSAGLNVLTEGEETDESDDESLQEIFGLLHRHTGQDFSAYKSNTIHRRIARRMNVNQLESYARYLRFLRDTPEEIDTLFRELLINVTNFFRDPEAWEALAGPVAELVGSLPVGSNLRVWVPGCSSGEEVFSIAILLDECMQASDRKLKVQIFGTDLDSIVVDHARAGLYAKDVVEDLTPERLEKYFTNEKGKYRIRKDIRAMTIFAVQNIIMDPPFTQIDLICCRNLLIYLNADIQRKVLSVFHYALKPDGLLFLGSSETIGSFSDLFEPLDKRWRIFRRRKSIPGRRTLPEFPLALGMDGVRNNTRAETKQAGGVPRRIERALLSRFAPASVIVNERGDIVYVHGRTGDYLEPSEGQPRNNILEMAREGLRLELTEALGQAVLEDTEVVRNSIRLSSRVEPSFVDLSVIRLDQPEELRGLILVSFRPALSPTVDSGSAGLAQRTDVDDNGQLQQLERAIKFMRETHNETLEELETSNEELEALNEELQSTNEELETSKEEMQSLNEELTTANTELQSKLEDLSLANDDMQNLLNSTKIATVFLDNGLKIKRFTRQAQDLIMLRQEDVGRPVTELVTKLQHEDLGADCRGVLNTLVFKETEVSTSDGGIYLMRIMPYRTATNAIDGLVLTFVDISGLKQAQQELRHMAEVFQEGTDPAIIVNLDGTILDLNDAATASYGYARKDLLGKSLRTIMTPGRREEGDILLNRCRDGEAIRDLPWRLLNRSGAETAVRLSLTVLTGETGAVDAIAFIVRSTMEKEPG